MVSVVMPAYNADKYIKKAIDSILNQTYEDVELLIIEDYSTDKTLEIIKRYEDKRIRLFTNSKNMGIAYSTNIGLRESRGKYVALMDDDDIAAEDRLQSQVDYMESHPEIDILGGRSVIIDENDNYLGIGNEPRNNPKYIRASLLFKNVDFLNGTTMIRSEFLKKFKLYYHEECFGMQDYRFFIDSSKVGNISSINKVLLFYRVHEFSESQREKKENGVARAEKYFQFQCDSMKISGYQFDERSMLLIRKLFSEEGAVCDSLAEFKELVKVFIEMLSQAQKMEVDYFKELQHLCKITLTDQIVRMKSFDLNALL